MPLTLSPGSDVATLALLGYDPLESYTGRAPLEAAAQGVELGPNDWAWRCNLVCLENDVMKSFTAGHITSEDAAELLARLSLPTRVADLPGGATACSPDALFGAMLSDKKKLGAQIHFALLEDWGRAIVLPLDPSDLRAALPAIL